jgi:hypothetical protein
MSTMRDERLIHQILAAKGAVDAQTHAHIVFQYVHTHHAEVPHYAVFWQPACEDVDIHEAPEVESFTILMHEGMLTPHGILWLARWDAKRDHEAQAMQEHYDDERD